MPLQHQNKSCFYHCYKLSIRMDPLLLDDVDDRREECSNESDVADGEIADSEESADGLNKEPPVKKSKDRAPKVRGQRYECDICRKTFGFKSILKTHYKIHENLKEFECNLCHKQFNQRSSFNTRGHIRAFSV